MLMLYHGDGRTKMANLTSAIGVKWRDPLSDPGSISFAIPETDAQALGLLPGRIVKLYWKGHARVAARLMKHSSEFAVDDVAYRGYDSVPGVLSMWNEAVVWPEFPLSQRTTGTQRVFGAMSVNLNHEDTSWYNRADWHNAVGAPWSSSEGTKHRQPAGLSGPNPWWIARHSPFGTADANEVQWFRRGFTTYSGFAYKIYVSADDYLTLYLDGEKLVPNQQMWRQPLMVISGVMQPGKHWLVARVENTSINSAHNPVGLILALVQTDSDGKPVKGPPVVKTDPSWLVTDVRQGWHRATVIRSLHSEAVARGVHGPTYLRLGWDGARDSGGHAWTDKGEFIFDIASQGLTDIALQQAEKGFDLHVEADSMTVRADKRRGTDKSATVQLQLGKDGGSLLSYAPTIDPTRFTSALLHLNDGSWLHQDDTAGIAAQGRIEVGVALGSTSDTDTAGEVISAAFATNAHDLTSLTVEISTLIGPQLYQQILLGDTLTIPDPDGTGTIKGRVLAGTGDASDEVVRTWLEFVKDDSA